MRKALFTLTVLAAACGGEDLLPENTPGPTENQIETATAEPTADAIEPNRAELATMLPKIIIAEPSPDDIRNRPNEPCGGVCPEDTVCDEAINACVATHGAMAQFFAPGACTNPELEIDLVRSATRTYTSAGAYDVQLLDMTFTPRPATIVSRIVMLSTDWNVLSGGLKLHDRYYGELARASDEGRLQDFRVTLQSLFSERRRLRVQADNLYSPRTTRQELVLYAVHAVNPRTGLPAKVCFRRSIYAEFHVAAPNPCTINHPRLGYPLGWMQKMAPGTREYRRFTTNTSSAAFMDAEVTACEDMDLHGLPMLFRSLYCDTDYTDPLLTDAGLFTLNGPLFSGLRIRTGTVTFATDALDPAQTIPGLSAPGAADCYNRLAFRGNSVIRMVRGETRRFSLNGNIGQRAMPPNYYHTQFKVEYDSARLTAAQASNGTFRHILNLTAHQSVQVLD